jgi:FkbM family methyltransferase
MSQFIDGPMGRFEIPDAPEATRRCCEAIAREVWGGEYAHASLPHAQIGRVLDIGAGWGAFTVWAQREWPEAVIECYEPHAGACAYLRRNAPNAVVHETAVTVQPTATLSVGAHDTLDNWGARTIQGVAGGEAVAVLHPRDLPPCDILKCDAEGVEPEVLESYPHLAGVKAILYEFHNAVHRAGLAEFCRLAGFRCLREVQVGAHSALLVWGPSLWVRGVARPSIPKTIHQVWIGPKPPPTAMMDTWKRMHPDWQYKLWTDARGWMNQDKIDSMPELNGKADLIRYEILARYGGVALDADSICVRKLDDELLEHEAFACFENEIARPGLIACGAMGGIPGARVWRACVEAGKTADTTQPAWRGVGPGLLTRVAAAMGPDDLHVFPARMFIPKHFTGIDAPGEAPIYATQHWGSTVGYDKLVAAPTDGPLVSIVIPCYGQSRWLGDAIRSAKAQTYKNTEIIVVAGDDESAAVAERHKVKVVRDGGNGLANARNVGIGYAAGAFILPLDADDMLAPNFLAKTVPLANDTTIVGTFMQEFGERHRAIGLPRYDRARLLDENPTFVCSLFSKKLWQDVGGYNVAPFGYEDWSFWVSCCERGATIVHVEEPLFRYRTHGGQDSLFCLKHDAVLRAMIRLLHPDLAGDSAQGDLAVVRAMPEEVLARMKRRQTWFPDNEALRTWLQQG